MQRNSTNSKNTTNVSASTSTASSSVGVSTPATTTSASRAWQQTSQQTRQFQLWLKHGTTSFWLPSSSPPPPPPPKQQQQVTLNLLKNQSSSLSSQNRTSPTTAKPATLKNTNAAAAAAGNAAVVVGRQQPEPVAVWTIDQALQALSYYNNEEYFPTTTTIIGTTLEENANAEKEPQDPAAPTHNPSFDWDWDWDWVLDGHPEWQTQQQKTRTLLETLYPNLYRRNDDNNKKEEEEVDEEENDTQHDTLLLLQLGSVMGQQEYQFASFDHYDETTTTTMTCESHKDTDTNQSRSTAQNDAASLLHPNWQSMDDIFQQQQTHGSHDDQDKIITSNQVSDAKFQQTRDSDDYGDFQQAGAGDAWPASATPHSTKQILNDDKDDGDDFGDFQEATVTAAQSQSSPISASPTMMIMKTAEIGTVSSANGSNSSVPNKSLSASDDPTTEPANSHTKQDLPPLTPPHHHQPMSTGSTQQTSSLAIAIPVQESSASGATVVDKISSSTPPRPTLDRLSISSSPPLLSSTYATNTVTSTRAKANNLELLLESSALTPKPSMYSSPRSKVNRNEPQTPTTNNYSHSPSRRRRRRPPNASDDSQAAARMPEFHYGGEEVNDDSLYHYYQPGSDLENNNNDDDRLTFSPTNNATNTESRHGSTTNHQHQVLSPTSSTERDNDEDCDTMEESLVTEAPSILSSGIPSVVQLVKAPNTQPSSNTNTTKQTSNLVDSSLVIPTTVQMKNSSEIAPNPPGSGVTTTPLLLPPSPSRTKRRLFKPRRLSLGRDSSIASTHSSSLASPEGRFLRRTSMMLQDDENGASFTDLDYDDDDDHRVDDEYDNDTNTTGGHSRQDSLGSLRSLFPDGYCRQDYGDDTVQVMLDLEWDWIPYWKLDHLLQTDEKCDESYVPLWLDHITEQLSQLDTTHLRTCKKLYRLIQPHADELDRANHMALDLAKNLQLCQMYWERTHESVQLARYGKLWESSDINNSSSKNSDSTTSDNVVDGVQGAQQLLTWWDTKHSYLELNQILQRISNLHNEEVALMQRIESFDIREAGSLEDCANILEMAQAFQQRLRTPAMARLVCLDELRERSLRIRTDAFVKRLHVWLESTTVRCCHPTPPSGGFDPSTYQRLLNALVHTADSHDDLENKTTTTSSTSSLAKSICTTVHTALLLEIQRCFGMALLNPSSDDEEESDYDKELLALSTNAYLDPSKMAIWTHNLVTIRFDFELSKNHLPAIYHKLCWLLTNVLNGQYCLLQWHEERAAMEETSPALKMIDRLSSSSSSTSQSIQKQLMTETLQEMQASRSSIWNNCVKVLEECLEEYLKFYGKKTLFGGSKTTTPEVDEDYYSIWLDDLLGLEDVLHLTDQFLSLRVEFLKHGSFSEQSINDGTLLREKLLEVQKKHLRAVHVEAMNTFGLTLYREDWTLVPLCVESATENKRPSDDDKLDMIVQAICDRLISTASEKTRRNQVQRSKNTFFTSTDFPGHLSQFAADGNPFGSENILHQNKELQPGWRKPTSIHLPEQFTNLLRSYVGESSANDPLVPRCLVNKFLPWTARFLKILEKLPPMKEEVNKVWKNLTELFVTTAFRICCGSASNEKLVLGVEAPPRVTTPLSMEHRNGDTASTSLFGFARRSGVRDKPLIPTRPVQSTTDAEICVPLPSEMEAIRPVREYVLNAQSNLKGIAKLDLVDKWVPDPDPQACQGLADLACKSARVLEKRQASSWGCLFVSIILNIALMIAEHNHQDCLQTESGAKNLQALKDYTNNLNNIAFKLIEIANQICFVRAIRGKSIVKQILNVGFGWEESKLHEQANRYIDSLCNYSSFLWCSLANANKIPKGVIAWVWPLLVQAGFCSILDGFARIPFCSTEGRAQMSMDLAAFAGGINGRSVEERLLGHASAPRPPSYHHIHRGMAYVDTYVKVFYFPPNDALHWIKENYQMYQKNHAAALIIGAVVSSPEHRNVSLSNLLSTVDALYKTDLVANVSDTNKTHKSQ